MSFISYSSSLSTMIENDDDYICLINKSIDADLNKKMWNVSCIFIDWSNFNWHASFIIFFILNDSIILWSNFLNDLIVLIFLMNNHIKSFTLYSSESIRFLFAWRFCNFWSVTNFCLINSQMSFIFSKMSNVFFVSIRFLAVFFIEMKSKLILDQSRTLS
jgi:hypothetical protein